MLIEIFIGVFIILVIIQIISLVIFFRYLIDIMKCTEEIDKAFRDILKDLGEEK